MYRFIKKIFIFISIFILSFIGVFICDRVFLGNQYLGSYQAAILDKAERLESIDEPKILLIGNSNVCFGMNSALLEEEMGMPVVDMGLHHGLGNAFLENVVNLGVSEGDIVIVCHSGFADDDTISDPDLAWITLEHHNDLWKIVRFKDIPRLIEAFPKYLTSAVISFIRGERWNTPPEDTCYSRKAFNKYGDIVLRFNDYYVFSGKEGAVPSINDICINRLNQLNDHLSDKGATLLIAAYPICRGENSKDPSAFDEFENELRTRLNCEVISHYTDYFFPYTMFYNHPLHLTEEGAEIRTQLLISDLKKWKNKSLFSR